MREKIDLEPLSFDAKVVAGACFGMMGLNSSMAFQMKEGRPGKRCKAALDELVSAGVLSVETINGYGGVEYHPIKDCSPAFKWVMERQEDPAIKFPISVPLTSDE